MDKNIINRNFSYKRSSDKSIQNMQKLRIMAKEVAFLIEDRCPESREKSLALTRLEECVMWANASIVRNDD